MERSRHRSSGRWIAVAVVCIGHLGLVLLLALAMREAAPISNDARASTLVFINAPLSTAPDRATVVEPRIDRSISIAPPPFPSLSPSESAAPNARSIRADVDWRRQGEAAAQAAIDRAHAPQPRDLGSLPDTAPGTPSAKPFEWNPEPKKAGVSGLLPYVRLGKRCVIGLGFFGCALGDLPKPNAHLFDDMRDPNQPQSSVPDIPR